MTTDYDDLTPLTIGYSDPRTRAAWVILEQAQIERRALSIARAAADFGGYDEPETPGEYLYWLKDQAKVQEESGDTEDNPLTRLQYYKAAQTLWRYVYELAKLGIHAVPPTPRRKEGQAHGE